MTAAPHSRYDYRMNPKDKSKSPAELKIDAFKTEYGEQIDAAAAQHGAERLAFIVSGWGPVYLVRKPTFEAEMAFSTGQSSSLKSERAWAPIRLCESVIVCPSLAQFEKDRTDHGYLFADNIAAETLRIFGPAVQSETLKLA